MTLAQLKKKLPDIYIKVIHNTANYRGFYVVLSDAIVEASFNSTIVGNINYSQGFEFIQPTVLHHLYNKLKKNLSLTPNETEAFYEAVSLFNPSPRIHGECINFTEVLHKMPGVNFWTLYKDISKREIEMFNDYMTEDQIVDIVELNKIRQTLKILQRI